MVMRGSSSGSHITSGSGAFGWLEGGFDGGTAPGHFVSSALVTCEAPPLQPPPAFRARHDGVGNGLSRSGISRSGNYDEAQDAAADGRSGNTAVARLAVPGGWDSELDSRRLVAAGGGGVSMPVTSSVGSAQLIDPAVLPLGGGLVVTVTGVNLTAPGEAAGGGACRVRAVDVAARPTTPDDAMAGGGGADLECLTPAAEGWSGKDATLSVSPGMPAGLIGGARIKHPIPIAPRLAGLQAGLRVIAPSVLSHTRLFLLLLLCILLILCFLHLRPSIVHDSMANNTAQYGLFETESYV